MATIEKRANNKGGVNSYFLGEGLERDLKAARAFGIDGSFLGYRQSQLTEKYPGLEGGFAVYKGNLVTAMEECLKLSDAVRAEQLSTAATVAQPVATTLVAAASKQAGK